MPSLSRSKYCLRARVQRSIRLAPVMRTSRIGRALRIQVRSGMMTNEICSLLICIHNKWQTNIVAGFRGIGLLQYASVVIVRGRSDRMLSRLLSFIVAG
jgi:hypothetical protein